MKNNPFHNRAGHFIQSLIRQRDYLLMTGLTRRNPDSYVSDLSFLRLHLQVNGYQTDEQMARFWLSHHDKVRNLIPGQRSPVHESLVATYQELTREAEIIYSQNLISPDFTQQNSPTITP